MIPINLHHLYYFWVVAREGSIAKASQKLFLSQPAISAQIIQLEKFLKKKLFEREKKTLVLTEEGRLALSYANEIFNCVGELVDAMEDRTTEGKLLIHIGIEHRVSNQTTQRILNEVQRLQPGSRAVVYQGALPSLLEDLRVHALDIILSTMAIPPSATEEFVKVEAGEVPVHWVAAPALARKIKKFPEGLARVPLLLPIRASRTREWVNGFFERNQIQPMIAEELEDIDLLRMRALAGAGVAPLDELVVGDDNRKGSLARLNVEPTGLTKTLWMITKKRRYANPMAERILASFRLRLPRPR
jgi:LysR family transcriptional activator of nhaA